MANVLEKRKDEVIVVSGSGNQTTVQLSTEEKQKDGCHIEDKIVLFLITLHTEHI